MPPVKLMKTTWYPRVHDISMYYGHRGDSGVSTDNATIVPLVQYNENIGSASSEKTNPQNASFAETDSPACYPDSRINNITAEIEFYLTQSALETDKLHALKFAWMNIHTAFAEAITTVDDLSSETIGTILELQKEDTYRTVKPIWTGVDMIELATGEDLLHTDITGLTTDQSLEGVAFDPDTYYDALHYYRNGGKLKSVQDGLKWVTLTKTNPVKKFKLHIKSNVKRLNEYAFMGILTYLPQGSDKRQIFLAADTTNVCHLGVRITCRYNEWNENFNTERV